MQRKFLEMWAFTLKIKEKILRKRKTSFVYILQNGLFQTQRRNAITPEMK